MLIMQFEIEWIDESLTKIAKPANELAYYACMLMKRNFITSEEAVIFQKMGFTIDIVQEQPKTTKE